MSKLKIGKPFTLTLCLFASAGATLACENLAALDDFIATGNAPMDATCVTFAAQTGSKGTSCHWSFPFRDQDAEDFFVSAWTEIRMCRSGALGVPDEGVNHPDSFELWQWVTASETYRVSIKDKGAERRTFVFVSREPR